MKIDYLNKSKDVFRCLPKKYCGQLSSISTLLLFFVFLILFSSSSQAQNSCFNLFNDSSYDYLSELLTKKYPELSFITKDPEGFINTIQSRYRKQLERNPKKPLDFDYSEVAIPSLKFALNGIDLKMPELYLRLKKTSDELDKTSYLRRIKRRTLQKQIDTYVTFIKYLNELRTEVLIHLERGHIGYRETLEYLYFFTRAIGYFDSENFSLKTKFFLEIDRAFQGYKKLSIKEEYELYKERKFVIFQKKSFVSGFEVSVKSYLEALQHPEVDKKTLQLKAIIVPIFQNIDRDILMRMMPTQISLVGFTIEPINADGFTRPSGDFWMHDVRHESARLYEIERYLDKHELTDESWENYKKFQEKWFVEFENEKLKIQDQNIKEAVDLISFHHFHDRGFPFIPSAWLSRNQLYIYYGLIFMLKVSGQGTGFDHFFKNNQKAVEWLNQFWSKRLDEEINFLNSASK